MTLTDLLIKHDVTLVTIRLSPSVRRHYLIPARLETAPVLAVQAARRFPSIAAVRSFLMDATYPHHARATGKETA